MSSKAITPIVSIILLVLITVVVASSTYYWMNSVQANLEQDVQGSLQSGFSAQLVEFTIADTFCNVSTNNVSVIVMNTGSVNLPSGNAVVTLGSINGAILDNIIYPGFPVVASEELRIIEVTPTFTLVSGTTYSVRITIPGGKSVVDSCLAE